MCASASSRCPLYQRRFGKERLGLGRALELPGLEQCVTGFLERSSAALVPRDVE